MIKFGNILMRGGTWGVRLPMGQVAKRDFSFSWPCPRKLREVVKISAFEKENADTCTMLWNEFHHAKPENVSTVLTEGQYKTLVSRGKASPIFIHPVPKGEAPNHFVLVS